MSAALSQTKTFQFTPLREGRRKVCVIGSVSVRFQFTPLREGRHKHLWRYLILCDISIHAPPRGATEQFPFTNFHEEISIHAPPRGATKRQFQQKLEILFQFTPLREGRRVRLACVVAGVFISIHAPPRGATTSGSQGRRGRCYFNSRPSARGDERDVSEDGRIDISIHAPPRGATVFRMKIAFFPYFNSRPSARGDCRWHGQGQHDAISIHAPPRGATLPHHFCGRQVLISIHAPPRGATL